MLGVGLDRSGDAEQFGGVPVDDGDVGDGVLAGRQGAGLVEQDGVDGAHPFQSEAVLDEDAVAGGDRRRERDDEWDGEPERVRAGDDQDRDGADQRVVGLAEQQPDRGGQDRRDDGDVEQDRRCPVCQHLGP